MSDSNPLWPAQLDHLRIDTDRVDALAGFYREVLGMHLTTLPDGSALLRAAGRRVIIGAGQPRTQPYMAFRLRDAAQLRALRARLLGRGLALLPNPSPLFAVDAFAVRDPDGRLAVFGLPCAQYDEVPFCDLPAARLPARLQHVVVASQNLEPMLRFYEDDLGFLVSDYVLEEDGTRTVGFFRSDPEHHSFAVFRCPETRADHHAYETTCWNDIRDWADHLSTLHVKLWWGPGRHGPGNNLFFMIADPQGYLIELSAELEVVPEGIVKRTWRHEERSLNLWGTAFMRS